MVHGIILQRLTVVVRKGEFVTVPYLLPNIPGYRSSAQKLRGITA
jgi:hypothetical protein